MKARELLEMPQLIPSLDTASVREIEARCSTAVLKSTATLVEPLAGEARLWRINEGTGGVFFSTTVAGDIGYLARFKRVELHTNQLSTRFAARQVLIHRTAGAGSAKVGVGKRIFWDHLMPMFGALVTDSQQTEDGRSFWEYRIAEALELKKHVLMIDTNENTSIRITSAAELDALSPKIWGPSRWFQRVQVLILEPK